MESGDQLTVLLGAFSQAATSLQYGVGKCSSKRAHRKGPRPCACTVVIMLRAVREIGRSERD
jgi:hypothetical protein